MDILHKESFSESDLQIKFLSLALEFREVHDIGDQMNSDWKYLERVDIVTYWWPDLVVYV